VSRKILVIVSHVARGRAAQKGGGEMSCVRLGNRPGGYSSRPATVVTATIAHIWLGFDCLGVKSPLCI
jgi:hypothetical protein